MGDRLDYLDHLVHESARFAAAVARAPQAAPVPTCPGWGVEDLWWHLAEVQWYWGTIVRQSRQQPPPAQERPTRPDSRAELAAFSEWASAELAAVLAAADPQDPVWTWHSDQTVGFVRRRQAHEALIHRLDAELTIGSRGPMDAELCNDGVDEVLRVMYAWVPDWARFTPDRRGVVRLRAEDTARTWLLAPGRLTGSAPEDGAHVDEPALVVEQDGVGAAGATVTGTAADLDCWLWGRPSVGALARSGDPRLLAQLDAVLAAGID